MSKTVNKILQVAALVVAVAAAIPTGGGSFLLAASIAAPLSAGLMVASLVNTALLQSKLSHQDRQAAVASLSIGEVARQALFGQALTGGSLVDAFNYGGTNGTDWEVLVIDLVDHECAALVGFYVGDQFVSYTGDGAVAGYNGQLEVYWRPGTETQAVPSILTTHGPGWTANDNGAGVCFAVVAYKADKADAKHPIWTAGRPAFAWVLKGKKCYQARLDSSVGGSGPHRWSDPSTWAWTNNLIDCRYNWVRGIYACNRVSQPDMLLVGRGLSTTEAPPANVFAGAALCDEVVTLDAGGTEKRYTANGVIIASEAFIDVEEHFAAACGGVIYQPEGAVEIEPGHAKSAVFYFSDADLLVGSKVDYSDSLPDSDENWVNTVVPRYVEPSQKYADHAAPIRRLTADVLADGGPREQPLSLVLVTSATQAGRVGEISRRLGRLPQRAQVTLGPRYAEVEEGDWGVWTSPRYLKGASVTFRVEAYSLDEKWQNTLTLRAITASVYARDADAASTSVALQQDDPGPVAQPAAGAWTLTSSLLTNGTAATPALSIIGATDNDYAELVRFEYLPAAGVTNPATDTGWREDGTAGPDVRHREIASVAPATAYYAAVSYLVGGRPGPRLILGPVNTGYGVAVDASGEPLASLAQLNALASDGVLSHGSEKTEAIIDSNAITDDFVALDGKYATLGSPSGLSSARNAAYAALQALDTYLSGLAPAWNDTTTDTPIDPATWRAKWGGAYSANSDFAAAITGQPGASGADGKFTAHAYLRSISDPATPSTGTGNPPTSWSGSIPSGADPVWQVDADFRGASQLTGWTTPARITPPDAPHGAFACLSLMPAYPFTSDNTHIYAAAFEAILEDGRVQDYPAGTMSGLSSGTEYVVFWDYVNSVYVAQPFPALTGLGNSAYAVFQRQSTSTGGSYTSPPTPPPGNGGGYCPADDTMVLLANEDRSGPGGEIAMRDMQVGRDWVWTRHETTGEWGAYRLAALRFIEDVPVVHAAAAALPQAHPAAEVRAVRATLDHPVGGSPWTLLGAIGAPDGTARIAVAEIEDAHTYVSNGVLSHNKLSRPVDD